jgi:hypothetical protein
MRWSAHRLPRCCELHVPQLQGSTCYPTVPAMPVYILLIVFLMAPLVFLPPPPWPFF